MEQDDKAKKYVKYCCVLEFSQYSAALSLSESPFWLHRLEIRQNNTNGVHVPDVREEVVQSSEQGQHLFTVSCLKGL